MGTSRPLTQTVQAGWVARTDAATEGDIQTRRPGMFDMLGRAKWYVAHTHARDAWERQRGFSKQDAKQLYVESMIKILHRFEDRPVAISLMAELEAYSGDVAEQVMSGTLAETASIHSSSVGQSPRQRALNAVPSVDESSLADEPPRAPSRLPPVTSVEGDTHTGSGSHDTITGSDMPRPAPRAAPEKARRADRGVLPVRGAPATQRRAAPRPRASLARRDESMYSGAAASDRGSRSFASAAPSLPPSDVPLAPHAGGPLGRYASSVGGRSGGPVPPARSALAKGARAGAPGMGERAPELEESLRAIQASLTALTDRLDRAESRMVRRENALDVRRLHQYMQRMLHDIGACLGLVPGCPGEANAPSYDAWRARHHGLWALVRSPFKFAVLVASLAFRVLLDLASITLMVTLLVAALRRLSGRSDPWITLRLLGQLRGRLQWLASPANRQAALRALLTSMVLGGVAMESTRSLRS